MSRKSKIAIFVLMLFVALGGFEALTGEFYHHFVLHPSAEKALKRRREEMLYAIVRNASSWYRVCDDHIDLWISCPSKGDVLLTGVHEDGTVHYRLTYTTIAGKTRVIDNGLTGNFSRMIRLEGLESGQVESKMTPGNTYGFRIPKPDNLKEISELSHCFRAISLAGPGDSLLAVMETPDVTNHSVMVNLRSRPYAQFEGDWDIRPVLSKAIAMPGPRCEAPFKRADEK